MNNGLYLKDQLKPAMKAIFIVQIEDFQNIRKVLYTKSIFIVVGLTLYH